LRQELADWFETEAGSNEDLKKAEARLAKLERMEKNLQRLVIERIYLSRTSRSTGHALKRSGAD
jgi:hypothetical protein